ncbi:MAG: hypothetical protein WEB37_06355 [Bacteroidota bacterium]
MRGSGSEIMRACLSAFLFAWIAPGLHAQESVPKPINVTDSTASVSFGFDRSLETFRWTERLLLNRLVGGISLDVDQHLRSRLIKSGRTAIQDELGVRLAVGIPVTEHLDIRTAAVSSVLSDNTQLDLGNRSEHQVLAGPWARLTPWFSLSAMGGYEAAAQQGIRDQGFAALLELRASPLRLDEFDIAAGGRIGRSWLNPRTVQTDSATLSVVRAFSESAFNSLSFSYVGQEREFYSRADPGIQQEFQVSANIFRRASREFGIADTLVVQSGSTLLSFHASLSNRTIDRSYRYKSVSNPANAILDVAITEERIVGGGTVRMSPLPWLSSVVTAEFEERQERHRVQDDPLVPRQTFDRQDQAARRLTNTVHRSTLGLAAGTILGQKDFLNLSGSASILRYDTPDSLNTDDRDELLLLVSVEETHRFSDVLSLSVLADAAMSHLVYLSRFQSANNAWNRIIRLKPAVTFIPAPWLVSRTTGEVMANYTVFDFEDQVQSVRSFSFRQVTWTDSTWMRIGRSVEALIQGSVRIYERGILRWREFRERPEMYFLEQSYWPRISVGVTDHLVMGIGYRYFSQTRYRYEGKHRAFEGWLVSAGPTVNLSWRGANGGRVEIEGWRETQSDHRGAGRSYSNLSLIVGMML